MISTLPDQKTIERLRQRLLLRITKRYKVAAGQVDLGTIRLPFTRIENPDSVLDMVADEVDRHERKFGRVEAGNDMHLPYWAELWDSGEGVGRFLAGAEGRRLLAEAGGGSGRVLDLGCGMG